MRRKGKTTLRDWSFMICLILFGGVYLALFGLPVSDGGAELRLPPELLRIVRYEDGRNHAETGAAEQDMAKPAATEAAAADMGETDVQAPDEELTGDKTGADGGTQQTQETAGGKEGATAPEEIDFQTVGDDYFADAVFIGDSRTVGLYEYGGLEEISTFCCSTGLTIYKMFTDEVVKVPGQKRKLTVEEVLSGRQFSAVYLMLGINEMGTGTVESFAETYRQQVEHLRELQPDAVIYIQGIIKVTSERSEQGDYITNEGIEERNAELAKLADGRRIIYLDVNPLFCDESGGMTESYSFDGVHLRTQYISIWKEYLQSHAVCL